MKKLFYLFLIAGVLLVFNATLFSQQWRKDVKPDETNFYKIQAEFNKFWQGKEPERDEDADKGESEEASTEGWMLFKRTEWFWSPRVYPTGEFPAPDILKTRMVEHFRNHPEQKSIQAGNWTVLGPSVIPTSEGGVGRINCVAINPSNTSIMFIGSPAGGLWKTTNGGTSWATNTDILGSMGVTSMAFDPTNANTMYIATGDGDAGDTYSIGILKSTDGGTTFNSTGLSWTASQTRVVSSVVAHPTDATILLAATNNGIYRTTDAGTSWTLIVSGSFKDLDVDKSNPTVWYAAQNSIGIFKSTNTGASFTQLTSGLPTSGFGRSAVAIAPSATANVYAVYENTTDGFYGLYKSTNNGTSWTQQSTTPNILSWDGTGTDGQGWYDLVLDVDPNTPTTIYVGGINLYKSTASGSSWTKITHWYSGAGYPYIHADQHGFAFLPGSSSTFFAANDGGIFKTTNSGTAWSDLSSGLAISEFYRLSNSQTNANRIMAGAQDNGTDRYLSGAWARVIGGDGMEALIDYNNENIMYGEYYNGAIQRTTDGGSSFTSISGFTGAGGWVTPYIINPKNPATIYLGSTYVNKSLNRGTSWTTISNVFSTLVALAIAPSDTNTLYAASSAVLNKTTNGGTTWTNVTSGLPSASITYVAIHPTNPQIVYVTFSGYASGKVYKTTNGGTNWTNVSSGLPSIPTNCIAINPTVPGDLYVGTDVGVYYSSDAGTSWTSFSSGLPNVVIDELEFQVSSQKLRAATFGRGLWETTLQAPTTATISGTNFFDVNNNGVHDAGEGGLSNWKIKISGTASDSILTDANGNYTFSSLQPGNYTVSEVQQNGWTQTLPTTPGTYSITAVAGQLYTGKDFGNYQQSGSISGTTFNDANNNGIKDVGEAGLANWRIRLTGTKVDSLLTDANGNYSFLSLLVGSYTLSEVVQANWVQTLPASSGTYSVSLSGGQVVTGKDFGNHVNAQTSLTTADFEDGIVPPTNWSLVNTNGDTYTWQIAAVSGYGVGTKSTELNCYSITATYYDDLITPILGGFNATDTLMFDYAYAQWSTNLNSRDSLHVLMSVDGGSTYTQSMFYDGGATLATAPAITGQFTPTSAQWKTAKAVLGAQASGANIQIKFRGISGYGNNIYVDNIKIKTATVVTSIGGAVFNDVNANGVKDAGEAGLSGWKIRMGGAKVDSVNSDANGNYSFINLNAGTYSLSQVVQSGWFQTLPASAGTYSVVLTVGQNITGKDFGNYSGNSIGGTAFNDLNGNGVKDAGEGGLTGWKIKLSGVKTDSVLTDVNGIYIFSALNVGNYTVAEVLQPGWAQTLPASSGNYSVTITAGQNITAKDFGNFQFGSITGLVFHDLNGNGVKDAGDQITTGWMIKMTGAKVDSVMTDAFGNYTFNNVPRGNISISQVLPNWLIPSFPITSGIYNLSLTSGQNVTGKNFGYYGYASISGVVFNDINGDGIKDSTEPVLSNWKVKLSGAKTDSVMSAVNGTYAFVYLNPGSYTVTEVGQSGWQQTLPVTPGTYTATLTSMQNMTTANFGNFQYASLSGMMFNDQNGNGVKDGSESGLSGWQVRISGTKNDTTLTDVNGNYTFSTLMAGSYTITLIQQSGWMQTVPASSGTYSLTVVSGQTASGKNFGAVQLGTISGKAFEDVNGNGQLEEGEANAVNIKIKLSGTKIDSVITGQAGTYSFVNLPLGSYTVKQVLSSGSIQTLPQSNGVYSIPVSSGGVNAVGKHFGIFKYGSVTGTVYNDLNGDTVKNGAESGMAGLSVFVQRVNEQIPFDSTLSDGNGAYSFTNLLYGSYKFFAKGTNGTSAVLSSQNILNQSVASGSVSTGNNLAMFFPGSITGTKFHDLNANGALDSGEPLLSGTVIYLTSSSKVESTLTDVNGAFSFSPVFSGSYTVTSAYSFTFGQSSTLPHNVSVVSGSQFSNLNFGEFKNVAITAGAMADADGDSITTDQTAKQWFMAILKGANADTLVTAGNTLSLTTSVLKPGVTYSVTQSDSASWAVMNIIVTNNNVAQTVTQLTNGMTGVKFTAQSGDSYSVTFISTKPDTTRFRTFKVSTDFSLKSVKLSTKNKIVTIANIRDSVLKRLGGLTLGLAQKVNDSAKKYGWVAWKTGADVAAFYNPLSSVGPYPFDSVRFPGKKSKLFIKSLKATRKVYDNKLAEEFGVFKINIAASVLKITPQDFAQLMYSKSGNPFDGMYISKISDKVDTMMTKYKWNGAGYDYNILYTMLKELNASFYSILNQSNVTTISPLKVTGDVQLKDVHILKRGTAQMVQPDWLTQQQLEMPQSFEVSQNYPNPFNPVTVIRYQLPENSYVTLKVYDVLGKEISVLVNNEGEEAGLHEAKFDATRLSSGIYFYRFTALNESGEAYSSIRKMILLK